MFLNCLNKRLESLRLANPQYPKNFAEAKESSPDTITAKEYMAGQRMPTTCATLQNLPATQSRVLALGARSSRITAAAAPNNCLIYPCDVDSSCAPYFQSMLDTYFQWEEESLRKVKPRAVTRRAALFVWMIRVQLALKLSQDTLNLALAICDQYLFTKEVPLGQHELLGASSMWISAKYCEIEPPGVSSLTPRNRTKAELVRTEKDVLQTLDWLVTIATPAHFMQRFLVVAAEEMRLNRKQLKQIAEYALELSYLNDTFLTNKPSKQAAACVFGCANKVLGPLKDSWPARMVTLTGYEKSDLEELGAKFVTGLVDARSVRKNRFIVEKYESIKRGAVANLKF